MSDTLIPALVLVGIIVTIIAFLKYINKRDRKKEGDQQQEQRLLK
jgi:hypothetical protein